MNWCYHIDEYQLQTWNQDGTEKGYTPSKVYENVAGFYPLMGNGECSEPWVWGKTLEQAQKICDQRNESIGVSVEERKRIVSASLLVSIREKGLS